MSDSCTLAAYYFGNYHPGDPRNTRLKGASWSEWQLVREARPKKIKRIATAQVAAAKRAAT